MGSALERVLRLATPPEPVLLSVVRSYERYERGRLERVRTYSDQRRRSTEQVGNDLRDRRESTGSRHGGHLKPWGLVRAGQLLAHGGNLFQALGSVGQAAAAPAAGATAAPAAAGSQSSQSGKSSKSKGDGAVTFKPGGYTPGPAQLPPALALQHQLLAGRQVPPGTPTRTMQLRHTTTGQKHTVTLPSDHQVHIAGAGDLPVM